MGMDKEANDIWMFGKPRPDLTPTETFEEAMRRKEAIDTSFEHRLPELLKRLANMVAEAKARGDQ